MKTKIINLKYMIILYFVLSILLTLDTYFQWESYNKPLITIFLRFFGYSGLLFMFLFILLTYRNVRKIKQKLILGAVLLLTLLEMNLLGTTYQYTLNISSYIAFLTFLVCILLGFGQGRKLLPPRQILLRQPLLLGDVRAVVIAQDREDIGYESLFFHKGGIDRVNLVL